MSENFHLNCYNFLFQNVPYVFVRSKQGELIFQTATVSMLMML